MATYYFTNSSDTTPPDGDIKAVSGGSHMLQDSHVVITSDNYSGGNVTFKSASASGTPNVTIGIQGGRKSKPFAAIREDGAAGRLNATLGSVGWSDGKTSCKSQFSSQEVQG